MGGRAIGGEQQDAFGHEIEASHIHQSRRIVDQIEDGGASGGILARGHHGGGFVQHEPPMAGDLRDHRYAIEGDAVPRRIDHLADDGGGAVHLHPSVGHGVVGLRRDNAPARASARCTRMGPSSRALTVLPPRASGGPPGASRAWWTWSILRGWWAWWTFAPTPARSSWRAAPSLAFSLAPSPCRLRCPGDAAASLRNDRGVAGAAQGDREFVGARQFLEVTQGELFEELRRGAVQQRTADALTASDDVDETTFVQ